MLVTECRALAARERGVPCYVPVERGRGKELDGLGLGELARGGVRVGGGEERTYVAIFSKEGVGRG